MPAFQFSLDKRLRALGLEGQLAWAMLHDGALQLQDEANHIVRIPIDDIARIRLGYVEAKRRWYSVRIWCDVLDKPFEIIPLINTWSAYRETMNDLVRLLAEHDRLSRVETGSSKFDAVLGPLLMAIPTIGALGVSLFVLTNEPWWGRLIVPLIPVLLLLLLVWLGHRRHWPRTIGDVSELRVQLPPG